ncbi:MAG TPA: hypothetical protein VF181_01045 [Balneolaceae bacterium]
MSEQKRKEMFNREAWERILDSTVSPKNISANPLVQWFEISPLEKVEDYLYDYYGDEKELDKIRTTYEDLPNHKF